MFTYYLTLFICAFLGFIFHSGLKYKSLKDQATVANVLFDFKTYLKTDAVAIVLAFVSIFIWLFVFGEIVAKYPSLQGFIKTSFVVMGGIGSYVVQLFFSVAQKRINNIVDVNKTNKTDSIPIK